MMMMGMGMRMIVMIVMSLKFRVCDSVASRHLYMPECSIPVFHPPTAGGTELVLVLVMVCG